MYSHLLKYVFAPSPPLYGYSGCILSSLMSIHKNIFGELNSEQIHAAHVFARGRLQENIPGELFMYWFSCQRGFHFETLLLQPLRQDLRQASVRLPTTLSTALRAVEGQKKHSCCFATPVPWRVAQWSSRIYLRP